MVVEAFQELEGIVNPDSRACALQEILKTLVYGDPENVRSQLVLISDPWQRYVLYIELYAAHGDQRDLEQLTRVVIDSDADEVRDRADQISGLRIRVASGWRCIPHSLVMTSEQRTRMLIRSKNRLEKIRDYDVKPMLFGELCLQIELGDTQAIVEARKMAGSSEDLLDQVNVSIAKALVRRALPVRARQILAAIKSPVYRIEILMNIALLVSEFDDPLFLSIIH